MSCVYLQLVTTHMIHGVMLWDWWNNVCKTVSNCLQLFSCKPLFAKSIFCVFRLFPKQILWCYNTTDTGRIFSWISANISCCLLLLPWNFGRHNECCALIHILLIVLMKFRWATLTLEICGECVQLLNISISRSPKWPTNNGCCRCWRIFALQIGWVCHLLCHGLEQSSICYFCNSSDNNEAFEKDKPLKNQKNHLF